MSGSRSERTKVRSEVSKTRTDRLEALVARHEDISHDLHGRAGLVLEYRDEQGRRRVKAEADAVRAREIAAQALTRAAREDGDVSAAAWEQLARCAVMLGRRADAEAAACRRREEAADARVDELAAAIQDNAEQFRLALAAGQETNGGAGSPAVDVVLARLVAPILDTGVPSEPAADDRSSERSSEQRDVGAPAESPQIALARLSGVDESEIEAEIADLKRQVASPGDTGSRAA